MPLFESIRRLDWMVCKQQMVLIFPRDCFWAAVGIFDGERIIDSRLHHLMIFKAVRS